MFNKPISKIEESDLQTLVENQEKESLILEYKRELEGNDKEKKELAKDASAIANTDGGYLLIGMEEDGGKAKELVGTNKEIGRQPVEEWLESILISNIRPKLSIKLKSITLSSDPSKVAVVVHIPKSSRRPHMVIADGKNAYFKRHNYQATYADEHEVRSMFAESQSSEENVKEFLSDRNLINIKDDNFAKNSLSEQLPLSVKKPTMFSSVELENSPFILFSSCPKFLEERVDIASEEISAWLDGNKTVDMFGLNIDMLGYHKEITSQSIVSPHTNYEEGEKRMLIRYLQIFRNGYVEQGIASEIIWAREKIGGLFQIAYFTGAIWMYLKFIQKFYEKIGYTDEINLIISLVDVKGMTIHGFGMKNKSVRWLDPYDDLRNNNASIAKEKNIKIERAILISELNEESIENIVKDIVKRVSNAFGESIAKCFDDEGNFDKNQLRYFRNVH